MVAKRVVLRRCPVCEAEWAARKPEPPVKCPRCQARYREPEQDAAHEGDAAILAGLRKRFAHIPSDVNLADELIAERRAEAAREASQ